MGGRHNGKDRNWLLIGLIASWVVVVVGASVYMFGDREPVATQQVQGEVLRQAVATPTPSAEAKKPKERKARNVQEVLTKTKFVAEYRRLQPQISERHEDTNLAEHGLQMCADSANTKVSVLDMVMRFMTEQHPHPGPHVDRKYPAVQVQALALQQICPDLLDEYALKAGV